MSRILEKLRNDSGIEDNDTGVSAMQGCDVEKNAMCEWNR